MTTTQVEIRSLDGTLLAGTLYTPERSRSVVLMLHGINSERTEEGLYSEMAEALAERGISSLSIDMRGHGQSECLQSDFSLYSAANDVLASIAFLALRFPTLPYSVVSASFSAGITLLALRHEESFPRRLVLLNPRLDYKPWIEDLYDKSLGTLSLQYAEELRARGCVMRNGFCLGRAMVNEIRLFPVWDRSPNEALSLKIIHGTEDSVVPFESSRNFADRTGAELLAIEGSEHGFVDPASDSVSTPASTNFRRQVVDQSASWLDAVD